MKHMLVAAAVVAVMVVTACGSGGMELNGTLKLGYGSWGGGHDCYSVGGYADIASGTPVTVYVDNKIVAMGALGPGTGEMDPNYPTAAAEDGQCVLPFTLSDVPIDGEFFEIEVGNRGRVPFSTTDAASGSIDLVLG